MQSLVVVICTKDRPDSLSVCLASLAAQDRLPDLTLVVDSSENVDDWRPTGPAEYPGKYRFVRASPGLTHQRNVALDLVGTRFDFISFLDDDAVADPGYLSSIIHGFAMESSAAGICGQITNLPVHSYRRLDVVLGLDGSPGCVLATGVNILAFPAKNPFRVEWMSGCCMNFRAASISGLRFDEARNGNGLGEDVDFSMRTGARGELWCWPEAQIRHEQSPVNRDASATSARRAVVHRWKLAENRLGRVKKGRILASVAARAVRSVFVAARYRSASPLQTPRAELLGLKDVALERRHRRDHMYG